MGIMEAIQQAQKVHRQVLEETYTGICKVTEVKSIRDPITKRTKSEEMIEIGRAHV